MNRLCFFAVLVIAGCTSLFAQTTVDLPNSSGQGTYSGTSGFQVYAALSPQGYIDLGSGPVSGIMPSGGSFSGNGAFFTYSVPKVSNGTTQNVSGKLSVVSTITKGGTTYLTYDLYMTFSGTDSVGRAFSGYTTQLITVKTSNNISSSVTAIDGSTVLQLN